MSQLDTYKPVLGALRALSMRSATVTAMITAGCAVTWAGSLQAPPEPSGAPQHVRLAARSDNTTPAPAASTVIKAIRLAVNGKHGKAQALKARINDPVAIKLIDWLHVRSSKPRAGFNKISDFMTANPDWPRFNRMAARAEAELFTKPQTADRVLDHFKAFPAQTGFGMLAHARALLPNGKPERARELVRMAWRDHDFGKATEGAVLKEFKNHLNAADHRARLVRLIYARKKGEAARTAALISPGHVKMARAAAALFKRSGNAIKRYRAVPQKLRSQLVMQYALARYYRRKGQSDKARAITLKTPGTPSQLSYPVPWWRERWALIRSALHRDTPQAFDDAYRMAKAHSFQSGTLYVQGEFMSGWIALQFLKKPQLAIRHLKRILERDKKPLNLAQANYWLGRAYRALGDADKAREHYGAAAAFPTTFYGQLSRDALGVGTHPIKFSNAAQLSDDTKITFEGRELVQAIRLLGQAKQRGLLAVYVSHLAHHLDDGEEGVALATLAKDLGEVWLSVRVAKISSRRGVPLERFAYPKDALPKTKRSRNGVERALIYAISRQESEFNPRAVSHAGARGLMQVMPGTARRVAKKHGLRYRKSHLLDRPSYNVTLGTAFLGDLLQKFNGSYIATIAGYNAGPGRIPQWNAWYGDPRKGQIEPVDWIESIPFNETRNYVKRVMENVQVYRTLFGVTPLVSLTSDLNRGGGTQTQTATRSDCQPSDDTTIEQLIACN